MITPYDICLIGSGEKREQSVEHRQDERSRDAAGITEMRRIIVDGATRVIADPVETSLEVAPSKTSSPGQFIGDVDARDVESVEDWAPAPAELGDRVIDEAGRALRPWIEIGPRERAPQTARSTERGRSSTLVVRAAPNAFCRRVSTRRRPSPPSAGR
jgi:hypothetical protein